MTIESPSALRAICPATDIAMPPGSTAMQSGARLGSDPQLESYRE